MIVALIKGIVLSKHKFICSECNKERLDFVEIIGNYVDENGNSQPTTIGIIHKSKTGCHIVPAKPKGGI